jgi:hypothetical protein
MRNMCSFRWVLGSECQRTRQFKTAWGSNGWMHWWACAPLEQSVAEVFAMSSTDFVAARASKNALTAWHLFATALLAVCRGEHKQ